MSLDEEHVELPSLSVQLTTRDNPFNPFTEQEQWFQWDMDQGYNTPQLLDRVVGDLSEVIDLVEATRLEAAAMNWIVDEGPIDGLWTLVNNKTPTPVGFPTA